MSHRCVEQVEAGSDVRAHCLFREALKESQVFESRGVEDDVRLRLGDERVDECRISQVSEDKVVTGQKGRTFEAELELRAGRIRPGRS